MHQFAGQTPDDKIRFLFKVYDLDGMHTCILYKKYTFINVGKINFIIISQISYYYNSKNIIYRWSNYIYIISFFTAIFIVLCEIHNYYKK